MDFNFAICEQMLSEKFKQKTKEKPHKKDNRNSL